LFGCGGFSRTVGTTYNKYLGHIFDDILKSIPLIMTKEEPIITLVFTDQACFFCHTIET
jgi:hypothetical protein